MRGTDFFLLQWLITTPLNSVASAVVFCLYCFTPVHAVAAPLDDEIRERIEQLQGAGLGNSSEQNRVKVTAHEKIGEIELGTGIPSGMSADSMPKDPVNNVLDHVKVPGGIPLPSQEQVVPIRGDASLKLENPASLRRPPSEETTGKIEDPLTERPRKCSDNNFIKYSLHWPSPNEPAIQETREEKVMVYRDVLYIPDTLLPDDPAEIYGSSADIRIIGESVSYGLQYRLDRDNVTCLPFRRRIIGSMEYIHHGLSALKNYDSAPLGTGKLHAWVEEKFGK